MKIHYIIIAAALLFAGCKQNATEQAAAEATEPVQEVLDDAVDNTEAEAEPADMGESYFEQKAKTAAPKVTTQAPKPTATQPAATAKRSNAKAEAETIYVEAEGARGRVWGHVTMKGDRGTGTVHDEGENTWAVSVTRHGDELFAVDQNSRQYVFKLKK
ncbi:MAG: hypothetical protein IKP21_02255 [Bacteroidales bacterium]|nr:hypothetical protein [Bacteroidales bacterium]